MRTADQFTAVTQRNALRREAGLPLLDLRKEMAHMENVEAWRVWNAVCDAHAGKRAEIRARILETFAENGRDMRSTGGRMALGYLTQKEFDAYLFTLGHVRPDLPDRNVITYGGA